MSKINENIKKYRTEKNLTQEQLAEKVYSTKSTISKWESGDITPSIDILKIIAKALEVNVYDLMGEERPISSQIFTWAQKILGYLLLWIHVDISLLFTFMAVGTGLLIGGFALLASPIILAILNSASTAGWDSLHSTYFGLSFLFGPGIAICIAFVGYQMMLGTSKGYNLSFKYYWNIPFRIKMKQVRLNKMWIIIVSTVVAVGLITLSIFLGVVASTDGLSSLNYKF